MTFNYIINLREFRKMIIFKQNHKTNKMKNLFLVFAVVFMSLSFYSCRETTEDRADDRVEMGDDINSNDTRLETRDELEEHAESRIEEAEQREDTIN